MRWRSCTAGMLVLAAAQAWGAAADPADPKAAVAPLTYKSPFDGYRKHTDTKVESWQEMNDNVGRIGGWRVYLKEAQQPDPPAAAPSSPKPAASPKPATPRGQHAH